ncbi:FmdB family transcriptional regulator [Candidatus Bipolaricaulota bacterium]|nr:FmdB family transcriptional regulator [Candidatus Bipolaricaulota bacterium]
MPLFRYECKECKNEFRVLYQQGDDAPITCPSCGGSHLQRLPSRVSVQFKGSGYYKTDRANKKSKAGTKGLSEKETSETSLEGSSGDSRESKGSNETKNSDRSEGDHNSGSAKHESSNKSTQND